MKIMYITHLSDMYGANWSLLDLIFELRERGVIPVVLTPKKGQLTKILDEKGIKYIVVPFGRWLYPNGRISPLKICLYKIWNECLALILSCLMRFYKVQIVHTNTSMIYIGARIAKYMSLPHFWHIRELAVEACKLNYIFPDQYIRKMYSEATKIITISEFISDKMKQRWNLDNIVKVYDGINWNTSYQNYEEKDRINFCCVGLLSNQKRQHIVAQACKVLRENAFENFKVFFVGNGKESYINKIKEYILSENLGDYIELVGEVNDIQSLLQNMDVGIIASQDEAFGRVTVEYMLSSMPVIGTASGGTVELIQDGKNGYLVELDNAEELADKMCAYITNRNVIKEQGKLAYQYASSNFKEEKNAVEILELYRKYVDTVEK